MTPVLRILSAGPGVTVQDGGRMGYMRFGVTPAGPMDPLAHATANLAVGSAAAAAAIEVSLAGIELTAEGAPLTVAFAGGSFRASLDGQPLPSAAVARIETGARLAIRAGGRGAWCYVAVAGGIALAPQLGSLATHLRTGIGGLEGRALAAGDVLPVGTPARAHDEGAIAAPWLDRPAETLRVMAGPQDDYFTASEFARFLDGPWTLTARSDRMAYLLDGPVLESARGFNIVSDGIAMGAIQVPGNGQPIVLMADRQPTGGYPKIAAVIGADVGALAQLRPGATFRFRRVDWADAVAARRTQSAALAAGVAVEPLVRSRLSSDFLLSRNLIDGVTSGC